MGTRQSGAGKVLTLAEIYRQYPDEWVLVACVEMDKGLNIVRGEVLGHSPERSRLYDNSLPRKGKSIAIEYTGEIPDDLAILL